LIGEEAWLLIDWMVLTRSRPIKTVCTAERLPQLAMAVVAYD
jgi:hypothetical protein